MNLSLKNKNKRIQWVCVCVFTRHVVNSRGTASSVGVCFRRKVSVSLWRLKAALTRSWLLEQELSVMTHRPKTFMCMLLDQALSRFMRCQMSRVLWGVSYSLYQKWSDWHSTGFNKSERLGGGGKKKEKVLALYRKKKKKISAALRSALLLDETLCFSCVACAWGVTASRFFHRAASWGEALHSLDLYTFIHCFSPHWKLPFRVGFGYAVIQSDLFD